jgi:hypothetical protein
MHAQFRMPLGAFVRGGPRDAPKWRGRLENEMNRSTALALAFVFSLAGPQAAFAVEENVSQVHHHRVHHHRHHATTDPPAVAAESAPHGAPTLAKPLAPTTVNNDSDGLSRDGDDCNKGCLDNTE